jgi:hypothetical protein
MLTFDRNSHATGELWRSRAAGLARRLNFHHWLARIVPLLFVLLVVVAVFDLSGREAGLPAFWSAALFLFGLAIVLGWTWLQARRHFCDWRLALVRLETILGLHNQLSSAQDGVARWPTPPQKIEDGYSLNWKQILLPLAAGGLFLACAHLVPLGKIKSGAHAQPISEPPEIAQVQSWINALKAQALIQPDKLQEMQTALDKLRERPAQDWYTQGNLEAASSLKELTEQSMNSLARDLDKADQSVRSMQEKAASPGDTGALQPMQDQLRAAEQSLASGNLPLNQEVVAQLKDAESASDKSLTAGQLAALHDRLKRGERAAQTAPESRSSFSEEMRQAMDAATNGGGLARREMAAAGGVGGGKDTAPLQLEQRDKTSPDGKLTPVKNDDMSRASLGQTLKISSGAHAVDTAAYPGAEQAGSAQIGGNGGEAVWRSTYDPQEADTLDRFFK